jgi:hypothetical protein
VVFSQFTSFLDLIQVALQREHFEQYRFDGSMDLKKRGAAVSEFRSPSRTPKVLIVSLKAGGVGLNVSLINSRPLKDSDLYFQLTMANHVFMVRVHVVSPTSNLTVQPLDGLLVEFCYREPGYGLVDHNSCFLTSGALF